jgi:hypothetical protein
VPRLHVADQEVAPVEVLPELRARQVAVLLRVLPQDQAAARREHPHQRTCCRRGVTAPVQVHVRDDQRVAAEWCRRDRRVRVLVDVAMRQPLHAPADDGDCRRVLLDDGLADAEVVRAEPVVPQDVRRQPALHV